MANGDIAASVGYDVVAGSDDRRLGYDEINLTRDYIAQHRLTGTHDVSKIIGLDGRLDAIRLKPYIRRRGVGGSANVGTGDYAFPASLTLHTNRGNWTGGVAGINQNQFQPPVSGVYRINATYSWNRTDPGQSGFVQLQMREGMSANTASSGSVIAQNYYAISGDGSTAGQINDTMPLEAGTTYGFVILNDTTHSVERRYEALRSHYAITFETPIGEVA